MEQDEEYGLLNLKGRKRTTTSGRLVGDPKNKGWDRKTLGPHIFKEWEHKEKV